MKKYNINQEGLEVIIEYNNDEDLIEKLDQIICDLISYGYGAYDYGTNGMLEAIKNDDLYGDSFEVSNDTYDKDICV